MAATCPLSAQPDAAAGTRAGAAQPPLAARVRAGIGVTPDTVRVGDPFTITVRVQRPADARIVWPDLRDSTAVIAPRAPMLRREGGARDSASAAGLREETAVFEVAAWDTGRVVTTWPPAVVIAGVDTVPVRLADVPVHVRSVLPADTSEHVPRPAKPPFAAPVPWWQRWWPLWVALALLAAWFAWRTWRRRAPSEARAVVSPLGAHAQARAAFDRLDRLALAEAGEHGRTVTLAVEILRTYLAVRAPRTSLAQTSAELLTAVRRDGRVPTDELVAVLVAADTVKYAGRPIDPDAARRLVRGARAVVDAIEAADVAQRAAESEAPRDPASAGPGGAHLPLPPPPGAPRGDLATSAPRTGREGPTG